MTTVQRKAAAGLGGAVTIAAVTAVAFAIAGCSSFKQSLGASKQSPDETAIATRAPLVVPATFDLKTPQPGTPRPQDSDAAAAAQRVLGGGTPRATPASAGERELLSATGAASADPNIRRELGEEVRESRKRKSYSDTVLFWRGSKGEVGTPIDPNEEAQRVNASLPKTQAEPVIQRVDPAQPAPAPAKPEPVKEAEAEDEDDSGGWFDWF